MKLPRVRFTLRRMMIAVAVVVLATCFAVEPLTSLLSRYSTFGKQYNEYGIKLQVHRWNRDTVYIRLFGGTPDYSMKLSPAQEARRSDLDRWVRYEERLVSKYRRAMFFPWLAVEPDPPEPK